MKLSSEISLLTHGANELISGTNPIEIRLISDCPSHAVRIRQLLHDDCTEFWVTACMTTGARERHARARVSGAPADGRIDHGGSIIMHGESAVHSTRTSTGTEKSLRNQYITRTYSVKTGSPRHTATALNELIILCNQGVPRCKLLVQIRYQKPRRQAALPDARPISIC